ncbi:ATP-binding protein [Nocardia fluminea]|uniref:ATP-binding protein n=1 Tax=Nocardia fluminea TaxID=134984 RepID=UPI0036690792
MDERDAHLFAEIAASVSASMWAAAGPEEDYAIRLWNRGAEQLYGFTRDEALGENYLTLFVNELERGQAMADHDDIVRSGREFRNLANDIMSDGTERLLLTVGFPLDDRITGERLLAEVGIDVTDVPLEDAARLTRSREEAIRVSEGAARDALTEQLRELVVALTLSGTGEDEHSVLVLGVKFFQQATNAVIESSVWLTGRRGKMNEVFRSSGWEAPAGLDIGRALEYFRRNTKPILLDSKTRPHRRFTRFIDSRMWLFDTVGLIPLHAKGELLGLHLIRVPGRHVFTKPQREVLPVLSSVVLASARLVAEIRRRREEAAESRAEATRLRLNGDFAHRIRKAVDPILRDVQAIREELLSRGVTLDGDLSQWIDDIEEGCTELARAPAELRRAQKLARVSVASVLTALRNRLGLECPDVEILLETDHAASAFVHGVKGDVTALFENLLYNAIEAMDGRGCVNVTIAVKSASLYATVSDNGPGIPIEDAESVFQLGHSSKGEGRGLGLARAREIVTDLDGKISVQMPGNAGATILVVLPVSREK